MDLLISNEECNRHEDQSTQLGVSVDHLRWEGTDYDWNVAF